MKLTHFGVRQRVRSQWLCEQERRHSGAHQRTDPSVHPGISGTAVAGDHREPACNIKGITCEIRSEGHSAREIFCGKIYVKVMLFSTTSFVRLDYTEIVV